MTMEADGTEGSVKSPPSLLTTIQVAEWLGVRVNTLEHWRSRGRGPSFVRQDGWVRYRREDVEEWIRSRRSENR